MTDVTGVGDQVDDDELVVGGADVGGGSVEVCGGFQKRYTLAKCSQYVKPTEIYAYNASIRMSHPVGAERERK